MSKPDRHLRPLRERCAIGKRLLGHPVHVSTDSARLDREARAISCRSTATVLLAALLFIAAAGCASDFSSPSPAPPPNVADAAPREDSPFALARVVNVVDGATIDVEIDGRVFRVRYLGIEIPDMAGPESGGPSLRERALEFNRFHLQGQTVELETDVVEADAFGLLLRYVYVNGEMVNKALPTNGYATVAAIPPGFKHKTAFAVEEESAKRGRRGVWSPRAQETGPDTQPPGPSTPEPFRGGTLPAPPGMTEVTAGCDYSGTYQPVIKGNVDAQTGDRIYHVPGGLYYSTIAVDESSGDRWFCTEQNAAAAGWKKSEH